MLDEQTKQWLAELIADGINNEGGLGNEGPWNDLWEELQVRAAAPDD